MLTSPSLPVCGLALHACSSQMLTLPSLPVACVRPGLACLELIMADIAVPACLLQVIALLQQRSVPYREGPGWVEATLLPDA